MKTLTLGVRPANPPHAPRVPAGPNSLAAIASSRRGVLGAVALLPTLAAVPALAAFTESSKLEALIAQHEAAEAAFNAAGDLDDGSLEEVRFLATVRALDAYVPQTAHEFVRSFSTRFSNDLPPTDDAMEDLVRIARQLAAEGR